jgi:hypothetical protein
VAKSFPIILLFASLLQSQPFLQQFGGIPFTLNSINSVNPFNGGIDQPRFQMVDIDGDNDLDLFIFDKDTTLYYYRNDGSVQAPVFVLVTNRFQNLSFKSWFYFAKLLDNDNDYDLLTGGNQQAIKIFRNTGSPNNPVFEIWTNALTSNAGDTIIGEGISNHHVADIDADGDLDLFLGSSLGTILYYRNIGNASVPSFLFVTDRFANIEIIGGGDKPVVPAGAIHESPPDNDRHGANSIIFSDNDCDGDLDLFWGDFFQPSIYYIKNTGSAQSFAWTVIDSSYPHPTSWQSLGYNMPRQYDIDNDGLKDLFIGVLYGSQTKNNFVYYRNLGSCSNPSYTKVTENFVPNPDVGSNSFPAPIDIDNDGDFDLFIGSDHSTVSFYRNTGSASSPAFTLVTDSLPIISISFNYAPCFGDLNSDSKKDLLLGAFDGKIRFLLNTSSNLSNPQFTLTSNPFFDTVDVGQSSTPALVDIDNDGDLDLFVGNWNGRISYYVNNGNASAFNFAFVSNFYLSIDVGDESTLTFTDIDGDGDKDMFIGRRDGRVSFYRNDGSPSSPNFVLATNSYEGIFVHSNSVPQFADLDNDSDKDIIIGNIKGGLYYFENRAVIGIEPIASEVPNSFKLYQNRPNPFNAETKIRISLSTPPEGEELVVHLAIYDLTGREVVTLLSFPLGKLGGAVYEISWSASGYPSGVYFCRLTAGSFSESKRMVLVK